MNHQPPKSATLCSGSELPVFVRRALVVELSEQSAVETVGPAVVAAAEEFAVAAARGGVAGAMAANVIKAPENAVLAARDEERFSEISFTID